MRVTGGKMKGARLKALPRRSIRPATGLAKRAIFSLLENRATNWSRVLDLYAGSGALGIEALSRRAQWADFVDHRRSCCDIIRGNLGRIGELERAHVYCCTVNKALSFLDGSYGVIFMDPPYADLAGGTVLGELARSKLPAQDSLIVLCHSSRVPFDSIYDGLRLVQQRRYGDTCVSIYQREV